MVCRACRAKDLRDKFKPVVELVASVVEDEEDGAAVSSPGITPVAKRVDITGWGTASSSDEREVVAKSLR